jgi:acyl carrier protein phosphodiesterase
MQANLYGDFIKGSHLGHLPEILQRGIALHRSIDYFIDNHPAVRELLIELREDLPKVAGIAIDIYFDHLLARYWDRFHPQPLGSYLNHIYAHFNPLDTDYSPEFRMFLNQLIQRNWISHYPTLDAIERMSQIISVKLSFSNRLANGKTVFIIHEKAITQVFFEYMADANEHFLTEELRILS